LEFVGEDGEALEDGLLDGRLGVLALVRLVDGPAIDLRWQPGTAATCALQEALAGELELESVRGVAGHDDEQAGGALLGVRLAVFDFLAESPYLGTRLRSLQAA
jgi:hypothetical protein